MPYSSGVKYLILFFLFGCSSVEYNKTVEKIDIEKFMGRWFVQAGRFTFLEKGAFNAFETYTYNKAEDRIDIDFTFNKKSLDGEKKSIPQKGWIHNKNTNAHWKVSPFWPLKFDYLVIDLAADYSWTAIGVPNQKYLWIMSRSPSFDEQQIREVLDRLNEKNYDIGELVTVEHGK